LTQNGGLWLYLFKNRTVFDIVEDILDAASRPVTKSLMQRASGVRWDILDDHLDSLVELGLIRKIDDDGKSFYQITNLGIEYVKAFKELKDILDYQIEKQVGIKYLKYL